MNTITIQNLQLIENEPRIRDVTLALSLGLKNTRDFKSVIARNTEELQQYGSLSLVTTHEKIGCTTRPIKTYYLNEPQALLLCMFSRTDRAAQVRKELIDVYMAYRTRGLSKVREHYRRQSTPKVCAEPKQQPAALPVMPKPEFHPSGRSFMEWYITVIHSIGAMRSEYEYLKAQLENK